jgi:hypothetical protein
MSSPARYTARAAKVIPAANVTRHANKSHAKSQRVSISTFPRGSTTCEMDDSHLLNAVAASFCHLDEEVRVKHDPIRPYLMNYLTAMIGDLEDADLTVTWRAAFAAAKNFLSGAPSDFFADQQIQDDAQNSHLATFEDGTVLSCEPKRLTELRCPN